MSERHMREAERLFTTAKKAHSLQVTGRGPAGEATRIIAAALEAAELRGVRAGLTRAQGVTAAASERLRGANRRRCSAEMDIATLAIAAIDPASVDVPENTNG